MSKKDGRRKWTDKQEEMIRKLYPSLGPDLAELMGIDRVRLKDKAMNMGVRFRKEVTEEQKEDIRQNYLIEGPTKIAARLGLTVDTVVSNAKKMGIGATRKCPPKSFEWTEEMLTAIKERYVKEGGSKLAEEFGCTIDTVRRKASSLGFHTIAGHAVAGRKRAETRTSINIRYFDQWTPDMAYILGFLFADGTVDRNGHSISANVVTDDECILQFIKEKMEITAKIHQQPGKKNVDTGGWDRPYSIVFLSSTILVEKALGLGLKPRKTFNDDPFPSVPDEMMSHFVRGYLDGDGTVCIYSLGKNSKNQCCSIGFVGSPKFITGLRDALVRLASMRIKGVRIQEGKTVDYADVNWTALDDLQKFYKFVYPEGFGFCLERKRKKLEEWLAGTHYQQGLHYYDVREKKMLPTAKLRELELQQKGESEMITNDLVPPQNEGGN